MLQILVQPPTPVALNDCRLPQPLARSAEPAAGCESPALLRPHTQLRTLALDEQHVVAFVPSLSQVAVLNRPAVDLLRRLPLADPEELAAYYGPLRGLAALGLLVAGEEAGIPAPPAPSVLSAWLHLTNACTLQCTYCYINKSAHAMSPELARRAVDTVVGAALRHGYPEVALKYAGGEPLLALDTLEEAHAYARARCAEAGLGLQTTVLTNGTTLTPRRVARLRELGVGVTVSLDGLAEAHDGQRPTLGGGGSAAAATRGLEAALAGGLRPTVAITVTGRSVGAAPELATWLLERGVPFTVSFYRENDCSQGRDELAIEEAGIVEGMRALYAAVERNPPPWSVLGALLDRADLSHAHGRACAAGEHYLVIDHEGRVAKCQMALGQPVATVSDADPLMAIRLDPRLPLGTHVDEKEGCRACEWRYWCGGGCPIATLRATGRTDVKSPNCAIYKSLYPDLIRLEGRRLLQYGR